MWLDDKPADGNLAQQPDRRESEDLSDAYLARFGASLTIDAHQHFWDPARGEYPWLLGAAAALRRLCAPQHLAPELQTNHVHGTIVVQTQARTEETRELLALAEKHPFVLGVVGWVDLTGGQVAGDIAELRDGPHGHLLVGLRHLVHDEPDPAWLLRDDVQQGLAEVQLADLSYDLLLRPREMPAALELIRNHPFLRFVVDHLAKPDIRNAGWQPWADLLVAMGQHREHVWCKLSGMTTLANHHQWSLAQFRPYLSHVLQVFGPTRCMFGSDWPVCTLAGSYADVCRALHANLSCDAADWRAILADNAVKAYRLDPARIAALGVPA
jgi:L-fuconolactonase